MRIIVAFKHKLSDDFFERQKQKLIKFWTKSNYYHVEIAIDDEWVSSDPGIGVVKKKLKELNDKYDYFEYYISDCNRCEKNLIDFVNMNIGDGYDWEGIMLSQFIKIGIDRKSKWFCSEFVSKALQILGIRPFVFASPNRMSPESIYKIVSRDKSFTRIFEK